MMLCEKDEFYSDSFCVKINSRCMQFHQKNGAFLNTS
uniref:Uncharacterized protein n=1 Tax=Anguilla anguilla TaxID=7936 RepID=A0A0E9TU97_ANGAN